MDKLSNNSLAFIALSNEFCASLEKAPQFSKEDFTAEMLRLLPRIYITASDITKGEDIETVMEDALDENHYNEIRSNLEVLFGEDDTFLEVFEEDMKYSDTPVAENISEILADLFQVFYNFVETVRDAPLEVILAAIIAVKNDFADYWSQKLCNVLRPLNNIYYRNI